MIMEEQLIKVVLKNKVWFYSSQNRLLYGTPDLRGGTFNLNILTSEEREELNQQVDCFLKTKTEQL